LRAAVFVRDTTEGRPAQKAQTKDSLQTNERERKVKSLVHTVRQTLKDFAGQDDETIENVWEFIERTEMEIFNEDVSALKDDVLSALIGQKQLGE
jgi:hypothetical protein